MLREKLMKRTWFWPTEIISAVILEVGGLMCSNGRKKIGKQIGTVQSKCNNRGKLKLLLKQRERNNSVFPGSGANLMQRKCLCLAVKFKCEFIREMAGLMVAF